MSGIKKYKAQDSFDLLDLVRSGIAIDDFSIEFELSFQDKYEFNKIVEAISGSFTLGVYHGKTRIEEEWVSGSLEGAVHNFRYILNHIPDDKKQEFVKQVIYNVTTKFLMYSDDKDHSQKFDYLMQELTSHLTKEAKISLYYFADHLSVNTYAHAPRKLRDTVNDDQQVIHNVKDHYKGIEKRLDHLNKYKERFESLDGLLERTPLYARLRVALLEYGQDANKSKNQQKIELRNMLKEFDQAGYLLSNSLISSLIEMYDTEINAICKKHWDQYNGLENKYNAFAGLTATIVRHKYAEISKEELEQVDIARKFISAFSSEDINKIFQTYTEGYVDEGANFILLLENEKVKEVASNIKIPIKVIEKFYLAAGLFPNLKISESCNSLAIENFETILLRNALVGVFEEERGVYSIAPAYIYDLIDHPEKNNDERRGLIRTLITKHNFDIGYFVEYDSKMNKKLDAQFLKDFKEDIDKCNQTKEANRKEKEASKEATKKIIKEMATELTSAAIGGRFADKVVRENVKDKIEKSLLKLSEYGDTEDIFNKIVKDKSTREKIIKKFAEIDKEAIQTAKDAKGLFSAIIDRLFNLIGMIFSGQENLGYIMKGRITGFEVNDGFVDKLRNETKAQGKVQIQ